MTREARPRFLPVLGLTLTVCLLMLPATTVLASHWYSTPVVHEFAGDDGDAWALAIRSADEPTSFRGNQLVVSVVLKGDHVRSAATMGIFELRKTENGTFEFAAGGVAANFGGDNQVFIQEQDPSLERSNPSKLELDVLPTGNRNIGAIGEIRSMEPGEWRYFVAWAAGSEESRLRLRGDGFELEDLLEGEALAAGNSELVRGEGVHARQGIQPPPGTSTGGSFLGAGLTAAPGGSVVVHAEDPLLGMFAPFHTYDACWGAGLAVCVPVGGSADGIGSQVIDGGFSNTSLVTPEAGHIWNEAGSYWLMPGDPDGSSWYTATTPGTYEFRVEHLLDATGPTYRDPALGTGVRLQGEDLLVSLASVDYRALSAVEEE